MFQNVNPILNLFLGHDFHQMENNIQETQSQEEFVLKPENADQSEERIENSEIQEYISNEEYFMECARYNDFEELCQLIKEGINVNYKDNRNNTALRI